ncbi:MAG: hypothetical protein EZS28_016039 [Streblomastix strix]|uniref:Protein kinase domain-containing protein n=1 Tax=Streblomastix strix TaxID=222440 RepID=A0A5J4W1U3_9EUKA|nr:MAG: hypothetical protein EZS28_016039 [Streblomastix strix]
MEDLKLINDAKLKDEVHTDIYLVSSEPGQMQALKIIQQEKFNQYEWKSAGILDQPEHHTPYVTKYFGAKLIRGSYLILMEFCNLQGLDALFKVKNRVIPMYTIRAIIKQIYPPQLAVKYQCNNAQSAEYLQFGSTLRR